MEANSPSPLDAPSVRILIDELTLDGISGRDGDTLSQALMRVEAASDGPITESAGNTALAAITILLAPSRPEWVRGSVDPKRMRAFVEQLNTELTRARARIALSVLDRLALSEDNLWWQAQQDAGTDQAARANLARLADQVRNAIG